MKLAFISLSIAGHFNPMIALARRLRSRGHGIVFLGIPDMAHAVDAAGLDFVAFGERSHPLGLMPERSARLAGSHGLDAFLRR